jgi:nitroimidazol reductase NimA-like FMN-containing flavoprotein (pyridoxamine 5'-phosphate oxidase superfamily)
MAGTNPVAELDPGFSSPDATASPWLVAREILEQAEVYWLTTVRPDGRPHVTPLIASWLGDALYFCTGPDERKAKNLAENSRCVITTGSNTLSEGLDVVVEGEAVNVSDEARLQRISDTFASKYGTHSWHFTVRDGAFHLEGGGGRALVFEVAPTKAFGFGKGERFSQTRWRFKR